MAHFNFVISQNAKWGHAGFYIDCHRMTVPENILLQEKHCIPVTRMGCSRMHTSVGQTKGATHTFPTYSPGSLRTMFHFVVVYNRR